MAHTPLCWGRPSTSTGSPTQQTNSCTESCLLSDKKFASRRPKMTGHCNCHRHPELSTKMLVLWDLSHRHRGRGRPRTNYEDTLKRDTSATSAKELATLMENCVRDVWWKHVKSRLRPPLVKYLLKNCSQNWFTFLPHQSRCTILCIIRQPISMDAFWLTSFFNDNIILF